MNKLPSEIINIILEYQGYHSNRNGKYICKLNLNSEKYDLLKKRPVIKLNNNIYEVSFSIMKTFNIMKTYNYHYTITTRIYSNKVNWYMDVIIVSSNKDHCVQYEHHYIYDHNIKQHLPLIIY